MNKENFVDSLKKTASTPFKFHFTSLLLIAIFYYQLGLLLSIAVFSILFVSVMLHEYGHVLAGRMNGVKTKSIIFTAFGAGAMMDFDFINYDPKKDFKISIAGPAVSFVLMCLGFISYYIFPNVITFYTASINFVILVFNLLPLYPMDGGRILCSLLAFKLSLKKSLQISYIVAIIGCIGGLLLAITYKQVWLGIMFSLILLLSYSQRKVVLKEIEGEK